MRRSITTERAVTKSRVPGRDRALRLVTNVAREMVRRRGPVRSGRIDIVIVVVGREAQNVIESGLTLGTRIHIQIIGNFILIALKQNLRKLNKIL